MIIVPIFCPGCATRLEWRVVGPHRERHLACPACRFVHYDNPAPCAGVLVTNGRGQLLLGRRGRAPFRGWWNILGGFVEGREHPEETARREVREESGIEVRIDGLLGIWMDRYGRTPEQTLNIMYHGTMLSGVPTPGDDVVALRWFDAADVPVERVAFRNGREAVRAWLRSLSESTRPRP